MSSREMWEPPSKAWPLEPGDTGVAIIVTTPERLEQIDSKTDDPAPALVDLVKVNDRGAHADRDASEQPPVIEADSSTPVEVNKVNDWRASTPATLESRVDLMVSLTDIDRGDLLAWIIGAHPSVFDDAARWLMKP